MLSLVEGEGDFDRAPAGQHLHSSVFQDARKKCGAADIPLTMIISVHLPDGPIYGQTPVPARERHHLMLRYDICLHDRRGS